MILPSFAMVIIFLCNILVPFYIRCFSRQGSKNYNIFISGDLWLSNILFRYATHPDTGETIPVEVKFIDFQAARFASLATDLVLFLFTSVQVNLLDTQVGLYPLTFLSLNHNEIETEMHTY